MQKYANVRTIWPEVYNKLKNPPPGLNLGGLPGRLPPLNKVVFDNSPPPEKSDALAYVTTADASGGKIDTIHLVAPNLERHLQNVSLSDLQGNDVRRLYTVLAPFVEILAHELGHQKDFKADGQNPFPGGEGAAEQSANQALREFSVQATNNQNRNDLGLNTMNKTLQKLLKLSTDLDYLGEYELSEAVFAETMKLAQHVPMDQVGPADATKPYTPPAPAAKPVQVDPGKIPAGAEPAYGAQLYHPDQNMYGQPVLTSSVGFSWGSYQGSLKNERYFIANGRHVLGSVQVKGDPFTYEEAAPGKLRVVSGPEKYKSAIGKIITDPRTPKTELSALGVTNSELLELQAQAITWDTLFTRMVNSGRFPKEKATHEEIVKFQDLCQKFIQEKAQPTVTASVSKQVATYESVESDFSNLIQSTDYKDLSDPEYSSLFWGPKSKTPFGR